MESLFLIVGLGNPGAEYARTRHNAGFLVVETLAARGQASWAMERKFRARMARREVGGSRMFLCQPQTYMNVSGEAVGVVAEFFRIPLEHVLVVVDDADLPLGEIRLRPGGGTGGHRGLESIETRLGSREFARQRIGIGRGPGLREITGHVLGRFSQDEAQLMERVVNRAADQVESWSRDGIRRAMNDFNGVVEIPGNEGNEE